MDPATIIVALGAIINGLKALYDIRKGRERQDRAPDTPPVVDRPTLDEVNEYGKHLLAIRNEVTDFSLDLDLLDASLAAYADGFANYAAGYLHSVLLGVSIGPKKLNELSAASRMALMSYRMELELMLAELEVMAMDRPRDG